MSRTIDERVVSMQFDNKQFESNVQTSLSTLDKLKQSLKLDGAAKGLDNLGSAAKNVNMSVLGNAVESVRVKFSALEVMAVTALANITNSAVNAGKRLVAAFTIEPIKTGLAEYETQINAVQTILANTQSKGTTLDQVNAALDELNTYADKTIYNFTEMTRNIGTFTAAGVDLDTSVQAIKGIANLAAVSGSTSQQASTAMYQLSQALASGTVKLMDWNSVVNAGMGGQVFQDALKETARVHRIAIDDMIKKEGSFRETLSNGWLSSQILTETLSKFTGDLTDEQLKSMGYTEEQIAEIQKLGQTANDAATKVKTFTQLMDTLKEAAQSGWAQTWRIVVGDFEEAKALWTDVSDIFSNMINESAEARNKMLQAWADAGGRDMAIEALKNAFNGLMSVIKPIKEAFREIFPPITSQQLLKFTEGLRDLTSKFILSKENAEKLKSAFKGIFSVIDIGVTFIKSVASGILKLIGNFSSLGKGILNTAGSLGDWLSGLRDSVKETNIFGKAVDGIVNFIQRAIDRIKEFSSAIKDKFNAPGFDGFLGVVNKIWEALKTVGSKIVEIASAVGGAIANLFRSGDIKSVLDVVNGGLIASILLGIKKYIGGITDAFDGTIKFGDRIKEVLNTVSDSLEAWQQNLKADMLLKIAGAIAILAASLFLLSTINEDKLSSALVGITALFADLIGSLAIFNKLNINLKGVTKTVTAMIGISVAVLILAGALKTLSDLSWEELAKGVTGVLSLTAIIIGAAKMMSTNGKKVVKGATQMVIMAAALKILASVCKDLAQLSWEELAKGLAGVGVLLTEIAIFLKVAKFGGKAISTATGIVLLSAALKILASVCGDFAVMKWGEIGKGLAAIGALLLELVAFTNLAGNAKHIISTGVALIAVAAAMKIFVNIMNDISKMSWGEIAKGLTAIGGALILIAGAMNIMPKGLVTKAVGLIGVATAITILGKSLSSMSGMSWEEIGKGLTVLGGSMLILAVGLNAMKNTIAGSAALFIAAAAFAVLTPVLKTLGSMSLGQIGKGLLALAGVFVVFGLAALALQPIIPVMFALSAALLVFGAGCALVGAGILAISIGLSGLAATIVITASSIIEVIKTIVEGLGSIIVSFCKAISESAPAIAEAFVSIIAAACYALTESSKTIAETFFTLLVDALTILKSYIPQLVDLLVDVLVSLIDKLSERIPELANSAANLIKQLVGSIVEALGQGDWNNLLNSMKTISLIFLELSVAAKIISMIPIAGAITGIAGLAIVVAGIAGILAALGGLAQIEGFEWIIGEGTRILGQIGSAIGAFVGNIVGNVAEGISSSLPKLAENLSAFMDKIQTFVNGAKNIDDSVLSGVGKLAAAVLCITSADVISGIASFLTGGSSLTKFGEELSEFGSSLKVFSDNTSGIDAQALKGVADASKALAEMADTVPNEGGIAAWFAGENSIAKFGTQLVELGEGLKGFANAAYGINAGELKNVANAAKALAEMTDVIPNEGGVVAWFTGDNSISKFGTQLVALGGGLRGFAQATSGIDSSELVNVADAAKALAEMTNIIPNEGGVVSWFAGENSISKFGVQISMLGSGLKGFADSTKGINAENLTGVINAAKSLAEMTAIIPNEGGIAAWFAGENSISKFGAQIIMLGEGLNGFAKSTEGINVDNLTGTINAAKTLAEMTNIIPNEGGVVAWFTGENSVSKFGLQITMLGEGLRGFAQATEGINADNLTSVVNAAKMLAEMTTVIPNEGGVVSWFTGENSVSNFGPQLTMLGEGLNGFAKSTEGINADNLTGVVNAAKTLSEITNLIPNSGGIASWFTGESSISKFGGQLTMLGEGLRGFSQATTGINSENLSGVVSAARTLVEVTNLIPNSGGVASWFAGEISISKYGSQLAALGDGIKGFATSVTGINSENLSGVVGVARSIVELTNTIPNNTGVVTWFAGETSIAKFGSQLVALGNGIKGFANSVSGINSENLTGVVNVAKTISELSRTLPSDINLKDFGSQLPKLGSNIKKFASELSGIKTSDINNAVSAVESAMSKLEGVAKTGTEGFVNEFKKASPKVTNAINSLIQAVKNSVNDKGKSIGKAFVSVLSGVPDDIRDLHTDFYSAGTNLVDGFASGITDQTFAAEAAASAMASAALEAAKAVLRINSPSKAFYDVGDYGGTGFVNALIDYSSKAYEAGSGMASKALSGVSKAISRINDVVNSNIDTQPTIRPVLDLSNVSSGVGMIDNMFGLNPSIGMLTRVGSISNMMNRNQNGANDDVISAIKSLGRSLSERTGDTYNVNGITYDDGSNIANAVKILVREANIEGRR